MKLSKAIRKGAAMGPQLFGRTRDGNASCALGAALMGVGAEGQYTRVCYHFPVAADYVTHPLMDTEEPCCVMTVIRLLNDEHRWTREQIADWVETVE